MHATPRGLGVTSADSTCRDHQRALGRLLGSSHGKHVHQGADLRRTRKATGTCDHSEAALDEQAGGITPVPGTACVADGSRDVTAFGEPQRGTQMQLRLVLTPLSREIGVHGVGKQAVEAVPGVRRVHTDHERVGPGQIRQQRPPVHDRAARIATAGPGAGSARGCRRAGPRAGLGRDRLEERPGKPVQHARAQQDPADRPRMAAEYLRAQVFADSTPGDLLVRAVPAVDRRLTDRWLMRRRMDRRQPQARGPALGSFQQPVPALLQKINTMGLEQRRGLPRGEREIGRTNLHQPSVETEPVQGDDRITRAKHQSQRGTRTAGEQLKPGRDRIHDQMSVIDDQHSGRGQLAEHVGQLPPTPIEAAPRCRPWNHRRCRVVTHPPSWQDAAALKRRQQMCPELSARVAIDRQPRDRSGKSGGRGP